MKRDGFSSVGIIAVFLACGLTGCRTVTQGGIPGAPLETGPAQVSAGEVPIELAGPNDQAILVPVTINGEGPFQFVLDTGATLTCVDDDIVKQLNLPEKRGVIGSGSGVAGKTGSVQMLHLESLKVGTAEAQDLMGCMVDLDHMEKIGVKGRGLLGLNFLKAYVMTLDFERKALRLEKPGSP
ncbi:MAG: retroviral-like aspartic protease family protein [Armatimonadetes bacterium]|nr:retroviral-like aspartic protease family protein [Armatimonadota bacterium]